MGRDGGKRARPELGSNKVEYYKVQYEVRASSARRAEMAFLDPPSPERLCASRDAAAVLRMARQYIPYLHGERRDVKEYLLFLPRANMPLDVAANRGSRGTNVYVSRVLLRTAHANGTVDGHTQ